jgi:lysozyme family protein/peptidoglycan hydrolase-like protein with peptidoglycan-binding domain
MVSFESLKSEYERNWANLEIRPGRLAEANAVARKAINGKATYQQVERLTGVPWPFIALCHYRESNFDFDTYLGNGETLHRVTCLVPKGRGPFASFADGAVDALRIENFVGTQDWGIARTLFRLECFNGLGYHAKGVNSPYLYGGSTLYGPPEARAGKFVADHVFDSNHVDSQLGTAVILHAMMSQDSSITLDGSPLIAGRSEPDDDVASSVLLMQQTLNKLGANPPLDEDGISGPKTKAAVSQFQQRNGLQDTGLLDGTTIAAVTRAGTPSVQPPNVDLSQILTRLENLARVLQGGSATQIGTTIGGATSGGTTTVANDPINLLERLLSLANNAAPTPGTATPTVPAPADQLKPVVDLLGALLNKDGKPVLGQVNGALGETIGKMLDGKKTALGIGGSLITALLSAVTASPNAGGLAGLFGTIASAVPGLSQFALPISLALTAWGVLGKMEKWAQGTAPPPKPTS